ncbi:hypothetical protein TNCV_4226201 [Trichonephila clavipes]|uniref:Uncharacterized protein n=1 Tax=Trichonephila clavipes TaxID=2585209 RepID=A0A8X6STL2_TRICX|nr:hypothetical protein TNCV_4226201 [Trichonephila clavipes]
MGDLTYVENTNIQFMYDHVNGNGRAALRIYHAQFYERRMRSHRSFQWLHIVNFVKHVHSTSPAMMLVDKEQYAVHALKKAF